MMYENLLGEYTKGTRQKWAVTKEDRNVLVGTYDKW